MITTLGELTTVVNELIKDHMAEAEMDLPPDVTTNRILNAVREYEAQGGKL